MGKASWHHGIGGKASWHHGIVASWHRGEDIMASWHHGIMASWDRARRVMGDTVDSLRSLTVAPGSRVSAFRHFGVSAFRENHAH